MSDYLLGVDAVVAREVPADAEPELVAERAVAEVEGPVLRPVDIRVLPSEISGVSDEAWTEFVRAMKSAAPGAVSASNEMGMFGMKPRRLADLGLMRNLRCTRANKRIVWVGDFVPLMTQRKFLASASAQYRAFVDSMCAYVEGLHNGSVPRPGDLPEGMSLSGVLAVLHRAGPNGFRNWGEESRRFSDTVDLFQRVNGIF